MGKYALGYRSRLSKDEILVRFYDGTQSNFSEQTIKQLGEMLGYNYLGYWNGSLDVLRFKTPNNKAKEACEQFESFEELVEWAEPKDLKMESRSKNLEETIGMIKAVDYCISNKDYQEQLDKIVKQLYKVK